MIIYRALPLLLAIICVAVFCYADTVKSRAQKDIEDRDKIILRQIKSELADISSLLFTAGNTSNAEVYGRTLKNILLCCGKIEGEAECASVEFECMKELSRYISDMVSDFPDYPDSATRDECLMLRRSISSLCGSLDCEDVEGSLRAVKDHIDPLTR